MWTMMIIRWRTPDVRWVEVGSCLCLILMDYDKPNAAGDRYQVLDERFNTMDALRDMVSQYFSDDIVEDLFSMGVYTEEDGYLYTTDEGRQMDVHIGETEFELTEETGEEKVYTVTVNYWGEEDNSVEVLTTCSSSSTASVHQFPSTGDPPLPGKGHPALPMEGRGLFPVRQALSGLRASRAVRLWMAQRA